MKGAKAKWLGREKDGLDLSEGKVIVEGKFQAEQPRVEFGRFVPVEVQTDGRRAEKNRMNVSFRSTA